MILKTRGGYGSWFSFEDEWFVYSRMEEDKYHTYLYAKEGNDINSLKLIYNN